MNKDLYKILGLSKGASDNDIKRAYRKLALKYHPDRQGGKSDAEKKEAEENFKEVSWAYDILSNPEKKQRYDQFGITDDQQQQMGGGFDASEIFKHFMGGFGSMFGEDDDNPFSSFFSGGRRRHQNKPSRGQSIRMQIPVSIDEILNGVHRDIKYDIKVRCDKCHGVGGDGVDSCPHCHGTGMITEVQRTGFGMIQNSHPCQYCGGTGQVIKNKCTNCGGTGFKTKEVTLRIDCQPGFENGYQMMFNGKGYESKSASQQNGDLLIELVYQFDTNKFVIQGNAIYEIVEIPYYDCILGKELEYVLPNGDRVKVKIPEYTKDKTPIDLKKRYGSIKYYIVVSVKMPSYIRKSEKELLENIRKENH